MQTRSSLQRRSNSESSDRVVVHIKPRSWGDETHEQPQTVQPKNTGFDFKNADWFSHDPGPRSPARVFSSIQAKLTVGAPNDQYEQEADQVAEQVMSTPDSAVQPAIQREAIEEEELRTKPIAISSVDSASLQQKCSQCEQEQVQRSSDSTTEAGSDIESQLNSSKGGGSPLSDEVRTFMEPRFGADFSQVRVHTGNEAVQMNRDLNAHAFTHKQNIFFSAGKVPAKDALTAHELTHVVQQTGGVGGVQTKPTQISPNVQLKCSACEEQEESQTRSVVRQELVGEKKQMVKVEDLVQSRPFHELTRMSQQTEGPQTEIEQTRTQANLERAIKLSSSPIVIQRDVVPITEDAPDSLQAKMNWKKTACHAACWSLGGGVVAAVGAVCGVGTVFTLGGVAIPCTAAIIAVAVAAGGGAAVCSDLCDNYIEDPSAKTASSEDGMSEDDSSAYA